MENEVSVVTFIGPKSHSYIMVNMPGIESGCSVCIKSLLWLCI